MYKQIFTYTDYNGVERKEEHYFNLTKSEIVKMQVSEEGGYAEKLQRAVDNNDGRVIMQVIDELIEKSYGVKSLDGKRFEKSEDITRAFKQTPAYDELFMELVTDADKAANFVNGILPEVPQQK
jgi:hypothetical protein